MNEPHSSRPTVGVHILRGICTIPSPSGDSGRENTHIHTFGVDFVLLNTPWSSLLQEPSIEMPPPHPDRSSSSLQCDDITVRVNLRVYQGLA